MATKKKSIDYYLNLPWSYTVEVEQDASGAKIYVICVNELPGVCTDAPSIQEGMDLIKDAMINTIKLYQKQGDQVPEPIDESQFKGNIAYRTTSKRHYLIAKKAQQKNTSLSRVLDELIDQALGR